MGLDIGRLRVGIAAATFCVVGLASFGGAQAAPDGRSLEERCAEDHRGSWVPNPGAADPANDGVCVHPLSAGPAQDGSVKASGGASSSEGTGAEGQAKVGGTGGNSASARVAAFAEDHGDHAAALTSTLCGEAPTCVVLGEERGAEASLVVEGLPISIEIARVQASAISVGQQGPHEASGEAASVTLTIDEPGKSSVTCSRALGVDEFQQNGDSLAIRAEAPIPCSGGSAFPAFELYWSPRAIDDVEGASARRAGPVGAGDADGEGVDDIAVDVGVGSSQAAMVDGVIFGRPVATETGATLYAKDFNSTRSNQSPA